MIPEATQRQVISTVNGENHKMSIDNEQLQHVMGVITDLYSDPEMAIIREYSTNALDAHTEAGVERPIEVTTPGDLGTTFRVRDFGAGLNADDFRTIYSRYGTSTKRDSNAVVGMLGLGCKSGLAYTDQFTVTGIKDGIRTVASIQRDEDGAGSISIVSASPTDEPSGVEVQIATPRDNKIDAKARWFFSYWSPGSVLLNGEQPEPVSGYAIGDDFLIADSYDDDVVVMGNVPYAVKLSDYRQIVARVPIGSFAIAPSREALRSTKRTEAELDKLRERFHKQVAEHIREELDRAETPGEAFAAIIAMETYSLFRIADLNPDDLDWQGEPLPTAWEVEGLAVWRGQRRLFNVNQPKPKLDLADAALSTRLTVITDFDNRLYTSKMDKKLRAYFRAHDLDCSNIIAIRGSELVTNPSGWFDHVPTVSWRDVRAWRDPEQVASGKKRAQGGAPYTCLVVQPDQSPPQHTEDMTADQIRSASAVYYSTSGRQEGAVALLKREHPEGAVLVMMGTNRLNKFKRLVPHAVQFTSWAQERAKNYWRSLSEDERFLIGVRSQKSTYWRRPVLPPAEDISDPILSKMIAAEEGEDSEHKEMMDTFRDYSRYLDQELPREERQRFNLTQYLNEHYPLLARSYPDSELVEHVALYLNAIYEQQIAPQR